MKLSGIARKGEVREYRKPLSLVGLSDDATLPQLADYLERDIPEDSDGRIVMGERTMTMSELADEIRRGTELGRHFLKLHRGLEERMTAHAIERFVAFLEQSDSDLPPQFALQLGGERLDVARMTEEVQSRSEIGMELLDMFREDEWHQARFAERPFHRTRLAITKVTDRLKARLEKALGR